MDQDKNPVIQVHQFIEGKKEDVKTLIHTMVTNIPKFSIEIKMLIILYNYFNNTMCVKHYIIHTK